MIKHLDRLVGVDPRLMSVITCVELDCVVLCGERDKDAQTLAYNEKRSHVQWPNSKHNICHPERDMAEAVDLAPLPINWEKVAPFYILAGAVLQEAKRQGIPIRWGGDWDGDFDLDDQTFNDLGHFELIPTNQTKEV